MRTIWTSLGSASLLCCLAAFLFTAEAEMQAADFWTKAAQGGMAEVALSNAALQRAQSEEVKRFAQQMVTDHTATNEELMRIASGKGITLPTTMAAEKQRDLDELNGRSGAAFDREYMDEMVDDHEKMVKLFQRESERGTDPDAKAFAAKTLPALQGHLSMARSLYETTKNAARSGNSSNDNRSSNVRQDTNRRPNVNNNSNSNSNRNSNSNSNSNSNTNSNGNSNNSNMNHF